MTHATDPTRRHPALTTADNVPPISRRDFCRSALVASSLVAAGLPAQALATGDRTPTNVRVSHDGDEQHLSPCLAVNSRDPRNMLAACMLTSGNMATYASFDRGRNWQSTGPLPRPAGIGEGGDLSAAFDGAGRGFICGLVTKPPTSGTKGTGRSIQVWRTDDGGRSFASPVAVSEVGALDAPWLATERQSQHTLHVVWAQGTSRGFTTVLLYTRSTDGGQTFEDPRPIASASRGLDDLRVACGATGDVYVIYDAGSAAVGNGATATVKVLCSHDRGRTFAPPIELGRDTLGNAVPGSYSVSFPAIAADPNSGLVCAAFSSHEPGADHAQILLTASRDQGRSWSRAQAITPQDEVIYFQPQVAINADGRIGVMAFAITHDRVSVVLMLSEPGSLRFGSPVTVTSQPFNPARSGPRGRWWIGDYQALGTTPGAFHLVWNDTRTGQLQLFTAAVKVRS
jgi:hypothetical protein